MTRLNISVHRDFAKISAAKGERPIRRVDAEVGANKAPSTLFPWLALAAAGASLIALAQFFSVSDIWSAGDVLRLMRLWR